MSPRKSSPKKSPAKTPAKASGWAALTWDDLDQWAGGRSVARGRTYQQQGRVKDLAIDGEGRLLATVVGRERYVVSVWLERGKRRQDPIESRCTCPVGHSGCKHAVATVVAYLDDLEQNRPVPSADPDDPRWAKLDDLDEEYEDEDFDEKDSDWEERDEEDEPDDFLAAPPPRAKTRQRSQNPPARRTRAQWDAKIREHLRAKGQEELAALVFSLVDRFPELRQEFQERIALGEGDVDRLVAQARQEIRDRTSEIGWEDHWHGEGQTPDYEPLKHRLERLVDLGHADVVVDLGREFIPRVMDQVEQSHDEGETAMAAADCLPVVFDAVMKSSLPAPRKILFAIDACLQDDYDVIDDSTDAVFNASWSKGDWSAVADELARRLAKTSKPKGDSSSGDFHHDYRRDGITGWLSKALENAGRGDEILAIYESEARTTNRYPRLVDYLIQRKKYAAAEQWAREGIERTRQNLPGIASSLAEALCKVAQQRRQWDVVAAHAAWEFFDAPSLATFDELVQSAAKAKCQKAVKAAALHFLETGVRPARMESATMQAKAKSGRTSRPDPAWPLPLPDYLVPLMTEGRRSSRPAGPHFNVLLDMALEAKKPDEVLRWYDKILAGRKGGATHLAWYASGEAMRVAAAVAKSHPERALAIYEDRLAACLPQAQPAAYEEAAKYLKSMRPILRSLGRAQDWDARLAAIREKYRNRPRFMEVLDRLDGRTILESRNKK